MCFTNKTRKSKKFKNRIVPVNNYLIDETPSEIGKKILNEKLFCENCKKIHPIEEFKMSCNGCDKLFHCGTAGRCIGKNCRVNLGDVEYRMPYCLKCVDLKLDINTKNNGDCICRKCQN